ncbi:MAG: ATP-binding cassette domain-containing protein [Clostridiales bacterium]
MLINTENLFHTITHSNKNKTILLNNISLKIPSSSITLIVGPTGSGKTLLCQHFNGLLLPSEGKVIVNGIDLNKETSYRIMSKFAYIFQNPSHQLFLKNVYDDITYGLKDSLFSKSDIKKKVTKIVSLLGIDEEILSSNIYSISDSDKKKIAIAGALLADKPSIIFDEPLWGFDCNEKTNFTKLILDLKNSSEKNIFIISHDIDSLIDITDYIVVMKSGESRFFDKKSDFFSSSIGLDFLSQQMHEVRDFLKKLKLSHPYINDNVFSMTQAKKQLELLNYRGEF